MRIWQLPSMGRDRLLTPLSAGDVNSPDLPPNLVCRDPDHLDFPQYVTLVHYTDDRVLTGARNGKQPRGPNETRTPHTTKIKRRGTLLTFLRSLGLQDGLRTSSLRKRTGCFFQHLLRRKRWASLDCGAYAHSILYNTVWTHLSETWRLPVSRVTRGIEKTFAAHLDDDGSGGADLSSMAKECQERRHTADPWGSGAENNVPSKHQPLVCYGIQGLGIPNHGQQMTL